MAEFRNAENIFGTEYAAPMLDIVAKTPKIAKILGQTVRISQKFIVISYKKNCLKLPPSLAIVIHGKWMK